MKADRLPVARVRQVLPQAIRNWIFDPNVTMIGIGWPEHQGQLDENKLAIRFHVCSKYEPGPQLECAIEQGETQAPIPPEIAGIPTDIVQGQYQLHRFNIRQLSRSSTRATRAERFDLLHCGIGISSEKVYGSGTLGALVRDRFSQQLMCLSNWHVMVGSWGIRPPLRILQPGRLDGATTKDTFAILDRDAMGSNLDAAVAHLVGERKMVNDQLGLGPVKGTSQAELGMQVVKSGYKTEITRGRVTQIDTIVKMSYNHQTRLIRHVFVIDQLPIRGQVSDGGDSGSLWLDDNTRRAVGLHFAGCNRPERALAMDIQAVLDALQVDLVIN
jgi:hypothetical protein